MGNTVQLSGTTSWFSDNGFNSIKESFHLASHQNGFGTEDPRIIRALADFKEFDGNPQGLRIVTRLQWVTDEYSLNFTKTTLASYLKYIRSSAPTSEVAPKGNFVKKCGFFISEEHLVKEIWKQFDYLTPQRFPLAYIMEAADDIAYCISDLEDSIEKGLLVEKTALTEIFEEWCKQNPNDDESCKTISKVLEDTANGKNDEGKEVTYTDFRTTINRILVEYAANKYLNKHESILSGELDALLPKYSGPGAILEVLKTYCRTKVYGHESVQRVELAGYAAIFGLLDHFKCLLSCSANRFNDSLQYKNTDNYNQPIIIEKKLLSLFPERHIRYYNHVISQLNRGDGDYKFSEWNARAHLVVDYISGMTDDFAMTTFRELSGMQL